MLLTQTITAIYIRSRSHLSQPKASMAGRPARARAPAKRRGWSQENIAILSDRGVEVVAGISDATNQDAPRIAKCRREHEREKQRKKKKSRAINPRRPHASQPTAPINYDG